MMIFHTDMSKPIKPFDSKWVSSYLDNFIPSGAEVFIGIDMATGADYSTEVKVKGFFDPKTGEYHIQEIIHNEHNTQPAMV